MNARTRSSLFLTIVLAAVLMLSTACNLASQPQSAEQLTQGATVGAPATRTPQGTPAFPTPLRLTSLAPTPLPGRLPGQTAGGAQPFPTAVIIGSVPTAIPPQQQNPSVPTSIVILSPIPGNVVAGNVQVLGSAMHPNFLQYQVEYGPDPNPSNLWYPATGAIQGPVMNNLLGIWNTSAAPDGTYQLRLRVFLRDATSLTTVVNSVRVQNRAPTPAPSPTPNTPRPIAAFTLDRNSGQAPLAVRFSNQSSGNITNVQWNFGDGTTSNEPNPRHEWTTPGLYTVTLTVVGPGGTSNVSGQITVQSPTAPNAGFTADPASGASPLTVQLTDQSTGSITSFHWNFSDGTGSTDRNPQHRFEVPGTYNVFLTVIGPGGSSSTRREITVLGPTQTVPPTLTASVLPPPTDTAEPPAAPTATQGTPPTADFAAAVEGNLTLRFTDQSTSSSGGITAWQWDFGDGTSSGEPSPLHQYPAAGSYTVTLTVADAGGSHSRTANVDVPAPIVPPLASFSIVPMGERSFQFLDTSTSTAPGGITGRTWDFGDGQTSTEPNPVHEFPGPGTYTVTLTVTDTGGSDGETQPIDISAPAQPAPQAGFSSQPAGDLTLQFLDVSVSASGVTAWTWDFGDGQTSGEQNPLHTYAAPGIYTVTLTITDAGGSHSTSMPVEVAAPALVPPTDTPAPEPVDHGLAAQVAVMPDLNDSAVRNNVRAIYERGSQTGNRGTVFAVAGDELARTGAYLDPFRNSSGYQLDDSSAWLQGAIDWYNQTEIDGRTSFDRGSVATGGDWRFRELNNPDRRDTNVCSDGETPLACELRLVQPAVVILSAGSADVNEDTNVDEFRAAVQQAVDTAANMGVIPVLTTIPPRPDQPERVRRLNDVLVEVARSSNVPLYNLWARLNGLPNGGLNADNLTLSQSPGGPGDLTSGAIGQYGVNARNYDVLVLLDQLHQQIYPDAGAFAATE